MEAAVATQEATAGSLREELESLPAGVLEVEIDDPAVFENPIAAKQLRDFLDAFKANPLNYYVPHAKQEPFHAKRRKIKLFLGGERSGKTVAGILDDLIQAVDKEVLPPHLLSFKIWEPPFTCRIITPDYGQGYQEILNTLREWCPPTQLYKGNWEDAYTERNHRVLFANGSFLEFMTQEQDVSKFGGTSRKRLHYDEEPKGRKGEAIREANVSRLIQYRGDEIFTFSPVNGLGTLGHSLWESKGPEIAKDVWDSDGMIVVVADQDDNPTLDAEGKREAEAKMSDRMRGARKSGLFVHAEGLVYESFDRDLHVCDPLDPEFVAGLERYECIDPGLNTGVLFSGFDSDNVLWIYDELFLLDDDAIPEATAQAIFAKRREWKTKKPKRQLIDPASAARQNQTNERTDSAYRRAGIKTMPANNDVELGITEVKRRLNHVSKKTGTPFPLIRIASNCERLLWEKRRYRFEIGEDGKLDVVKEDDHLCDCERYTAMARALPKRKRRSKAEREIYVPGTAPPVKSRRRPRFDSGPMGKFS